MLSGAISPGTPSFLGYVTDPCTSSNSCRHSTQTPRRPRKQHQFVKETTLSHRMLLQLLPTTNPLSNLQVCLDALSVVLEVSATHWQQVILVFPHPISTVGRAAKTAIQPGASVEEAMAGGSRAISIQEDNGTGVTPTASIMDVNKASRAEGEGKGGEQTKPGTISTGAGAAIGDSATVGWLQNSRQSALKLSDATNGATLNEIVSKYVSPEFYGTPYHNAAIVVFAVLATRFVTIFALSWAWIIVILTFCVTMYSLSIERTRKRARDDIERELMKMKLSKNTETVGWMNNMLHRAWLILEPVLSGQSAGSVQKDTSPQADITLLSNSYDRQHGRYGTPGCGPDRCRIHQVDHIHTR